MKKMCVEKLKAIFNDGMRLNYLLATAATDAQR